MSLLDVHEVFGLIERVIAYLRPILDKKNGKILK